jgi:hypothetical protein
MQLRTIMREGFLFAVRNDATVTDATRTMSEKKVGIVVVLEDNRLIGVFSERDVVRRVLAKGLDPTTPVGDVMTTDLVADERRLPERHAHGPRPRPPPTRGAPGAGDLHAVHPRSAARRHATHGRRTAFPQQYLYTVPPDVTRRGRK